MGVKISNKFRESKIESDDLFQQAQEETDKKSRGFFQKIKDFFYDFFKWIMIGGAIIGFISLFACLCYGCWLKKRTRSSKMRRIMSQYMNERDEEIRMMEIARKDNESFNNVQF